MAPAFKRRKVERADQPEELTFDPSARNEYLTGFHKRKEARKEAAREAAIKREKEERVTARKQIREQRKEELEQHVAAVNDELRKQNAIVNGDSTEGEEGKEDGEEAFEGFDDESGEQEQKVEVLPDDEEYVDEDKYTTVTVEPMGEPGDEGEDEHGEIAESKAASVATPKGDEKPVKKKRPWAKDGDSKRVKKKKFRYESKAERAVTRQKQKSKNHKAASARRNG